MKNFKMWASQTGLAAKEHKDICAIEFKHTESGKVAYYDKYVVENSFTKKNLQEIAEILA